MLKVSHSEIQQMEREYRGIADTILYFENMTIPRCPFCGSSDTAISQVGIIGRTLRIVHATKKFHLCASASQVHGKYFCNKGRHYYD